MAVAAEILSRIAGADFVRAENDAAGQMCLTVKRDGLVPLARTLRNDHGFSVLMDIVGVDFSAYDPSLPRFQVDFLFVNPSEPQRVRVRVPIAENDAIVPSLTRLYKSANWLEREVWDQFGIRFESHPDLRRILNHSEFTGHPLRKDFPVDGRQPLSRADSLELEK